MVAADHATESTRQKQTPVPAGDSPVAVDTATLVAVSALAWIAANVLHEIVGHAGAALALGIPVRAVSTTTASIEWDAIESVTQDQIINAAATPVNVLTGLVALLALRTRTVTSVPLRYFLWLFSVISFTMATWNMVTLPLLGAGDWGEVAERLDHSGFWTSCVIGAGVVVAIVGYRLPARWFLPDLRDHAASRRKIIMVPIATVIAVHTLSVLASPFATAPGDANHLFASVFAYGHLILWAILAYRGVGPRSAGPASDLSLRRSAGWLVTGLVLTLLFVAVLGPGIGPLEDDPRLDSL